MKGGDVEAMMLPRGGESKERKGGDGERGIFESVEFY